MKQYKKLLIANPSSNFGKGKYKWNLWKDKFNQQGENFDFIISTSYDNIVQIARDAPDFTDIIAVGGDGTINGVLNGLLLSQNKRMGVFYTGTSPDFCKFHHIPIDPNLAFQTFINGKKKKVDVIKTTYHIADRKKTAFFACSSNVGLGSEISRFANKYRGILGDTLGTALGVCKSIFLFTLFDAKINIDNKIYKFQKVNHIIIIKNPYLASGLKLNLNIRPDDGKMYILVIYDKTRIQSLKLIQDFYSGNIVNDNSIFLCECTSVVVEASPIQEMEFDGDPRGLTKASFELYPNKLPLIC